MSPCRDCAAGVMVERGERDFPDGRDAQGRLSVPVECRSTPTFRALRPCSPPVRPARYPLCLEPVGAAVNSLGRIICGSL
jgi:hypothetical protein